MKGTSTIQLFSADTRKEVLRVEDHNIVTNAYKTVFDSYANAVVRGHRWLRDVTLSTFRALTPASFFNGILLFANTQTEAAANVLLKDLGIIGHAGSAYAGSLVSRGSLNGAESGAVTNGYKFVWDFGTDKANGTIRSLSLVSQQGGDSIAPYPGESGSPGIALSTFSTSGEIASAPPFGCKHIGSKDGNIYVSEGVNGTMTIHRYVSPDFSAFPFQSTPQMVKLSNLSYAVPSGFNCSFDAVNNVLYGFLYNPTTNTAYLKTFDNSLTELTSVTLNDVSGKSIKGPGSTAFAFSFGVIGATLYVLSNTNNLLHKWDVSSGAYLGTVATPTTSYGSIATAYDGVISIGSDGGTGFYLFDGVAFSGIMSLDSGAIASYQKAGIKEVLPGMVAVWSGYGNPYIGGRVFLWGGMTSTINNLASAVTKTSANTMKITYQLNW